MNTKAHEAERRRLTEALLDARAKVSELAVKLGEAQAEISRLNEIIRTREVAADPRRIGGLGGKARAAALSPDRRSEIASMGAAARWAKRREG